MLGRRRRLVELHEVAVEQVAHRFEWAGDHTVAFVQAGRDFEVAFAGDADFDRLLALAAFLDTKNPAEMPARLTAEAARLTTAADACLAEAKAQARPGRPELGWAELRAVHSLGLLFERLTGRPPSRWTDYRMPENEVKRAYFPEFLRAALGDKALGAKLTPLIDAAKNLRIDSE